MTERELSFQISRVLRHVSNKEASAKRNHTAGYGFPEMSNLVFGINANGKVIAADHLGTCYEITVKDVTDVVNIIT